MAIVMNRNAQPNGITSSWSGSAFHNTGLCDHLSQVGFPKVQKCGALMFSSLLAWTCSWTNSRVTDDLRRHWHHQNIMSRIFCWMCGRQLGGFSCFVLFFYLIPHLLSTIYGVGNIAECPKNCIHVLSWRKNEFDVFQSQCLFHAA